jgi:hypothetical protein
MYEYYVKVSSCTVGYIYIRTLVVGENRMENVYLQFPMLIHSVVLN